jgi:tetratricopeptide (TPR) repeat protein
MRALAGLADRLWELGRKQEAISHYKELLRLNPNDNQGIRYVLANCLLEENLDKDLGKLLKDYEEDESCFILYSKALWLFRTCGENNKKTESALKEAIKSNKLVPEYLLGKKKLPFSMPDYYSWGSESEAVICASGARNAWRNTPGALEWLSRKIDA